MAAEAVVVLPGEADLLDLALAPLAGRPLLMYAVTALLRSTFVEDVRVLVPCNSTHERVRRSLGSSAGNVDVRPATVEHMAALVRRGRGGRSAIVVHDALVPLAPPSLVDELVSAVVGGASLALPVRPVTDALKYVEAGVLVGRADRAEHRLVYRPHVYSGAVAGRLLDRLSPDAALEIDALTRSGLASVARDHVVMVTAPEETFRLSGPGDRDIVDAMLAVRRG